MTSVGIVGAGKLGTAIGRLASRAGLDVRMVGTEADVLLKVVVSTLMPGAELTDLGRAAESDVVVLALPFTAVRSLDLSLLDRRIVVDATNHWSATDGEMLEAAAAHPSSTAYVSSLNPAMRVVKSLNHIAYTELDRDALPPGHALRRAMAVASDDIEARASVAALVDRLGFDPVEIPAADDWLLQPSSPLFGAELTRSQLLAAVAE